MTMDSLNLQSCGCFFILIRAGLFNHIYYMIFYLQNTRCGTICGQTFLYKAEQNLQLTF